MRAGMRRLVLPVALVCFVAACVLILDAARGCLWFDEIWSWQLAARSRGPWDVLGPKFDNNHVLNTLYLWAVGPHVANDYVYRLLSVGSGIASLATLAWLATGAGVVPGLFALVLAGSSYPLVLYWSEARGYAPAMLCALLAFAILRGTWTRIGPVRVVAFWTTLVLGVLAHLTFVIPTFALMVAALVHELRSTAAWWRRIGRLVALFAVPLAFHAWFYVVFVRDMRVIGGPISPYREVAATAAAMLLGMPNRAPWQLVAVAGCLAVVAVGSVVAWRRRPEEGVFYAAVLLVGPFGLLAVTRPEYLYYRYFVVTFPFFYLVLARLLGACCGGRPGRGALVAVLVIGPWVAGHGQRLVPLLRDRRGDERGALRYVSTHSPPGELRIAGDGETGVLLSFHARNLPPDQTLRMVRAAEGPVWLTTRSLRREWDPPPELEVGEHLRYRRVADYRHGGGSGWTSFLWRREDGAGADADAPPPSHE